MRLRNLCSVFLSLLVLAAGAAAQERGQKRAVNPNSPPVTLAPGQKARLSVGVWNLDGDGAVADEKGGVSLTLKFMPFAKVSAAGGVVRHRQVGVLSSGPQFVPAGQIVSYEWDFNFWDLNNDGLFEWDLDNDGALRAAVDGVNIYADGGSHTIYADNRGYRLSLSLEIVEKQTGKVLMRLGGREWD
jgi:hypothetical protein